LLEPIMDVEVEVPTEYQGTVSGSLSARRGIILGTEMKGPNTVINAEVPLANMFGYATDVRSCTQGKGTFSMAFKAYRRTPAGVQQEVIEAAKAEQREKSRTR